LDRLFLRAARYSVFGDRESSISGTIRIWVLDLDLALEEDC
jgi:hypothetical protein